MSDKVAPADVENTGGSSDQQPLLQSSKTEDFEAAWANSVGKAMDTAVQWGGRNSTFWGNLMLSLSVAGFVTFFSVPIYSQFLDRKVFGDKPEWDEDYCAHHIGSTTHPHHGYVWCGILPTSYAIWWPNVIQTAVFTIYRHTGSTVHLAWQGFCGTLCAVTNIYFLSLFYPHGLSMKYFTEPDGTFRTTAFTIASIFCWGDLMVVLFLFLASKADQNTMIWGMAWTVCLMLHFVNRDTGPTLGEIPSGIPGINIDGETTVVLLTCVMGCLIAILATVFPRPLMNITRLDEDAEQLAKGSGLIFEETINYMKRGERVPIRHQIYAKIGALAGSTSTLSSNLADSYWETFNAFGYGRVRTLYASFVKVIENSGEEVYTLKAALEQMVFEGKEGEDGGKIKQFSAEMYPEMKALKDGATGLLLEAVAICKDGHVDAVEQPRLVKKVAKMKQLQHQLGLKCEQTCNKLELDLVDHRVAPAMLVVFSLAHWAAEITDFAAELATFEDRMKEMKPMWKQGMERGWAVASTVFGPGMFEKEQLRFTVIFWIPIMFSTILSATKDESVFIRYSTTMPATLAVLCSYDYGATFFKDIQRLMGVVFGNVLPILAMTLLTFIECGWWVRAVAQGSMIFVYFFVFDFMYYASNQWGPVGCMIAGFGVYVLVVPCNSDEQARDDGYEMRYKTIAQVVIAVMLKMLVAKIFAPMELRDKAVDTLGEACDGAKEAYEAFLKGKIQGEKDSVEAGRKKLAEALATCETLSPKVDPKLEVVPGHRTPFKHGLFEHAVKYLRMFQSDIDMLTVGMSGYQYNTQFKDATEAQEKKIAKDQAEDLNEEAKLFKVLHSKPPWKGAADDLRVTLDVVFKVLMLIMRNDKELPIVDGSVTELAKMGHINDLNGMEEMFKLINQEAKDAKSSGTAVLRDKDGDHREVTQMKSLRLLVVLNALNLTVQHLGELAVLCFKNKVYG